jgi:hypothetical protein
MKEPEQSLVHEHARDSDETKAKCNFGFDKLGFEQHLEAFPVSGRSYSWWNHRFPMGDFPIGERSR